MCNTLDMDSSLSVVCFLYIWWFALFICFRSINKIKDKSYLIPLKSKHCQKGQLSYQLLSEEKNLNLVS